MFGNGNVDPYRFGMITLKYFAKSQKEIFCRSAKTLVYLKKEIFVDLGVKPTICRSIKTLVYLEKEIFEGLGVKPTRILVDFGVKSTRILVDLDVNQPKYC